MEFSFKKPIYLWQDTGFQGHAPKNATIVQPKKKPRGGVLTDAEKLRNTEIAKKRVIVEHAIRGVKIWRVAKDTCRYYQIDTRNDFVLIPAGLHNFAKTYNNAKKNS